MDRSPARIAACLFALTFVALAGSPPLHAAGDTPQIDLNRAGVEQLSELPGIGPAIAKRIVDFRDKNGPFRRVEDLMKVKGIGEKSLEKIRPHVRVGKPK